MFRLSFKTYTTALPQSLTRDIIDHRTVLTASWLTPGWAALLTKAIKAGSSVHCSERGKTGQRISVLFGHGYVGGTSSVRADGWGIPPKEPTSR